MSLIIAMLAGRIMNGLVNTCILSTQGYTLSVFMSASFITCLPGIVIQLIVIPVLVRILNKKNSCIKSYKRTEFSDYRSDIRSFLIVDQNISYQNLD